MTRNLEQRLAVADSRKDLYVPSGETVRRVGLVTKALGSLVGVTDSGKSHLIPPAIRLGGSEFSEAGNISSRANRPSDPAYFRGGQSVESLLDRIDAGELVQYTVHPSGTIYGTDSESYTTRFVLLPTLTTALPQLQRSGCFEVRPIGIVVDGETWGNERLGDNRNNLDRMLEARVCVVWLRARINTMPIIENVTGQEMVTAQTIVNILRDPHPPQPLNNRERVEQLLDELDAIAARHVKRLQNK